MGHNLFSQRTKNKEEKRGGETRSDSGSICNCSLTGSGVGEVLETSIGKAGYFHSLNLRCTTSSVLVVQVKLKKSVLGMISTRTITLITFTDSVNNRQ